MLFTQGHAKTELRREEDVMANDAETAAQALARWLAPYLAEELALARQAQPQPSPLSALRIGGADAPTLALIRRLT